MKNKILEENDNYMRTYRVRSDTFSSIFISRQGRIIEATPTLEYEGIRGSTERALSRCEWNEWEVVEL